MNHEGNPIVLHQTMKMSRFVRVTKGLAEDGFHRLDLTANEQNQSGRLMYLDHLPRQSQLQVAEMSVHYPYQRGDVVGQFGAAAVMLVVNKAKIVFKVNSGTYRSNRAEDVSQGLPCGVHLVIVRNQKRAPVYENISCQIPRPHHGH